MDSSIQSTNGMVKKQEDSSDGPSDSKAGDKRDSKPVVKTLNRVPRACNACRKQKMRCEGADNPPCRRCRHASLDCLFEKPSREATLTGEAGLERIRSLEAHVAEIRVSQTAIQSALSEIVTHLRGGATFQARSPSAYPPPFHNQSPSIHSLASPAMSTPPAGQGSHQVNDMQTSSSAGSSSTAFPPNHGSLTPMVSQPPQRQSRGSLSSASYRSPPLAPSSHTSPGTSEYPTPQIAPSYANFPPPTPAYNTGHPSHGPVLPPFSSIQTMGPPNGQQAASGSRYPQKSPHPSSTGFKRHAPSSNVTSADSSDLDDDENCDLPASGLVAPWEVLRGLAVEIERAKENGDSSEPHSRTRTPSPDRQSRPSKRRKIRHKATSITPDVVTKGIISEAEARELFRIFYHGCSTFLPVFDCNVDTYESLHQRSPFAVDCICMVAARVRDGGGKPSEVHARCLEEVQAISRSTLFTPVLSHEAVQAMILVSGWSDNGWLSGGHAVRMAMELSMHKAWPRLLRRMKSHKASDGPDDRKLVVATRIWFCLYLFEHQLSYGTGRPAILKDDESIWQCRLLLQHPLAIEDDMRLVSTVELMAIRERVNNNLPPVDKPLDDQTFHVLRDGDMEFRNWYATWDQAFSQKYEDAAFYRQSLQIQHYHAELFHNATALRGINGPDDVQKMPAVQRELAKKSIQIARRGLEVTVASPAYREGMKYAVHYTHATATFAASFLLRLARLFPDECDVQEIRMQVERLAELMSGIPGKRYALTLQVMLKRAMKRNAASSRNAKAARDSHRSLSMAIDPTPSGMVQHHHARTVETFSPTYDPSFSSPEAPLHAPQQQMAIPVGGHQAADAEHIWRGFEMTANEQLPVWLSDQSLGGHTFTQYGMDAFLLPTDYLPTAQIW